ncbi:hypothetical protein [Hymenobacter jejuensis]|uniref:DUF2029 domain-containing protein n=1 Tax=Hymenobacter jejuensis TaxID=2502781 RepID=A0A5B8A2K5_9BACT|nr:hypothetical protein [Hymenobacter jejuensis]QDA60916.1 hypothetical protein FHG12_12730 [Hymenobacter jejuensis]
MKLNYQYPVLYLMLFILLLLAVPHAGFESDMFYWVHWSTTIFERGLGNVYGLGNNDYNPLYHYILYLFGKMAGSVEKIHHYPHLLKGFTLLFDFAGAILAASLVSDRDRRFMLSLLLLFNMGYLYNTLIWIQVDSIFTCLVFVAALLAVRGQPVGSALFYVLALNAKAQAIIFLPPLLFLWFPQWVQAPKKLLLTAGAVVALQVLILAPFIWGGDANYLSRIIEINTTAVDRYPFITMNAANVWYLLIPNSPLRDMPDTGTFMNITYKHWGLIMFFLAAGLALLPLFVAAVRSVLTGQRPGKEQLALVLLSFGLVPLLFTYFNTQMHERYWHAAVLFLAAYGFVTREYVLYAITSIAYFLNLESVMHFLGLKKYGILFFDYRFLAGLFTLVIVLGIWKIYRRAPLKEHWLAMWHRQPQPESLTAAF